MKQEVTRGHCAWTLAFTTTSHFDRTTKVLVASTLLHSSAMAQRLGWTRDQLLIALRLYMRSPFGRLHGRNPEIIDLANRIGRTPNALAMKACNFAGLDPVFLASNRKGLSGASESDRSIWHEFDINPEQLAVETEEAFARLKPDASALELDELRVPIGDTDVMRTVRVRRVQSFFRAAVLTSYQSRCAISGLAVPDLLIASHIIPWSVSVEKRADPRNGICFNALFDRAFDRGFMTLDEDYRVVVSSKLMAAAQAADLPCSIAEAHGRHIRVPGRLAPDLAALEHHRTIIFSG